MDGLVSETWQCRHDQQEGAWMLLWPTVTGTMLTILVTAIILMGRRSTLRWERERSAGVDAGRRSRDGSDPRGHPGPVQREGGRPAGRTRPVDDDGPRRPPSADRRPSGPVPHRSGAR